MIDWICLLYWLGQAKKFISFSGQFQKFWWGREAPFLLISVGSNAVASYTRNNHACLWHKRFTDNDQQTYGPERTRKWLETDTICFSQCKNDQCGSKNTHAAVPEKVKFFFLALCIFFLFQCHKRIWCVSCTTYQHNRT